MLIHKTFVEGARAALAAAGLAGGNVTKNRNSPSTDAELPIVLIAIPSDVATSDGDARTNIVRMSHKTVIGIKVIRKSIDGPTLHDDLATDSELICDTLLSNWDWAGPYLEGIEGVQVRYDAPPDGNHVTGSVELQIDLLHRTSWSQSTAALPSLQSVSTGISGPAGEPQPGIVIDVPV